MNTNPTHPGHEVLRSLFPSKDTRHKVVAILSAYEYPLLPSEVLEVASLRGVSLLPVDAIKVANWINSI